ncbi:MAG: site-specific integrase [Candidatus Methanomethylophilaceae archaeon]|nr:site-specific integrase [Candidatus Methanomethylophilaceae archaeon]
MGRYPFTECLDEFLPMEAGHIEPTTMQTFERRLRQIGRIFHEMKEKGLVSTDNPKKITPEDIDRFVGYRKQSGVKASTVNKDLGNLDKLLSFYDNEAVTKFKKKFPAHIPKRYHTRGPSMFEEDIKKILDRAMQINIGNWEKMEAYGLVSLAICGGLRPKELRMLSMSNIRFLDNGNMEVYAVHVKGEKSYGVARWIPVRPDGVPAIKRYLEARALRLKEAGKNEDAVFPPIKHDGGYISYGRIRTLKSMVEEDLEITFDLRKCRRTFGQRAIKDGQPIHDVSLVMGHASVATTQREYCDKDLHDASQDMRNYWDSKGA